MYSVITKGKLTAIFAVFLFLLATVPASRSIMASAHHPLFPVCSVGTDEKKVAITFDSEWGNEQTAELMQILDDYAVKSTFFITGDWAEKYPDSVRALRDAGHEIGNHSNTHPHMVRLSREKIIAQTSAANRKIQEASGGIPLFFRPPYGQYSDSLLETMKSMNLFTVQWDVDSMDWRNRSPQQIYEQVIRNARPGSILLFHNGAKNLPTALPWILQKLRSDGYQMVPVSELVYNEPYLVDEAGRQLSEEKRK